MKDNKYSDQEPGGRDREGDREHRRDAEREYIAPQSAMYGTAEVAIPSKPRLGQGWA